MLYPLPVVLVTCQTPEGRPNIITVAWTGTLCTDPPMVSISVRPERHSHDIIRDTGEFVINIPTAKMLHATDYCGVVSGVHVDKFRQTRMTPMPASQVKAPLIAECPLHLECRVTESKALGSHTLFMAEIVAVQGDMSLMEDDGRFALEKAGLVVYAHGHYYLMGEQLGHFGFSVRKKPAPVKNKPVAKKEATSKNKNTKRIPYPGARDKTAGGSSGYQGKKRRDDTEKSSTDAYEKPHRDGSRKATTHYQKNVRHDDAGTGKPEYRKGPRRDDAGKSSSDSRDKPYRDGASQGNKDYRKKPARHEGAGASSDKRSSSHQRDANGPHGAKRSHAPRSGDTRKPRSRDDGGRKGHKS